MKYIQHPETLELIPKKKHVIRGQISSSANSLGAEDPLKSAISLSRIGDAVETITEVTEHLYFARELISKHIASEQRKRDLLNLIKSIEARAGDQRLNLAIVGEFNSGKSTFINALLRQRLLKAACVATTASVTHIELGKEFSITATFTDHTHIRATNTSYSTLLKRIQRTKPDVSRKATLNEVLDLLTSEQTVANSIKEIKITVPSDNLPKDFVIIDTPGINAGARSTESHAQITKYVLEQNADSAVVLVPSSSAMTDTLINFLLQNVKPFLHRCVFVLTAMDQLDPNDRPELVRMVKLKIRDKLKLPDALVLESSAITMIPVNAIPASMMTEDAWGFWQNHFVQIEAKLKQVMLRQRGIIITERLVRLLHELVNELSSDLDKKRTKLAQEEKVLRENSVAAIEVVMNTLLGQSKTKLERQNEIIESYINTKKTVYRTAAKSSASEIINAAGWDVNTYEKDIAPKVRSAVEYQSISYANDINAQIQQLRDCCESVNSDFVSQFELNYKAFPSLGVSLSVPSISVADISVPSISFSSSRRYVEQQNSDDNSGAGIGAVVGGILGFLVLGPPGAAAGAVLGGGTGLGVAGDSLEQRQSTLRSYAASDIDEFFDKYHSELKRQVGKVLNNVFRQLEHAVDAHIKEYSARVGHLMDEYRVEEQRLMQEIEEAIADSQHLSRRKDHLESLKQQLLKS
jgi:GTPase Era involved in 16S rRNA processing